MNSWSVEYHNKFPIIFRTKEPISCGSGWSDLIYSLCQELETIALSQKAPAKQTWLQKICFDFLLRIDPELSYTPDKLIDWCMPEQDNRLLAIQIKSKFGGLKFYTANHTDEASKLIAEAEEKSFTICEVCGYPGKIYRIRSWLTTLCEQHYTDRQIAVGPEKRTNAVGSKN